MKTPAEQVRWRRSQIASSFRGADKLVDLTRLAAASLKGLAYPCFGYLSGLGNENDVNAASPEICRRGFSFEFVSEFAKLVDYALTLEHAARFSPTDLRSNLR